MGTATDIVRPLPESLREHARRPGEKTAFLGTAGAPLVEVLAPAGSGVRVYADLAECGASPAVVVAPYPPPPEPLGDGRGPPAAVRWAADWR
ncbi:hypothetical protein ACFY93_13270 [Streptomyces sp. NPDC008313]|uniref:hypothetical protein n=1 Tax=Streptomyces sp. NPDC008313 TaxID=3364826 RepID=UPI0036E0A534